MIRTHMFLVRNVRVAMRNCHVSKDKLYSLLNGHTAIYVLKSLPLETWQFPHSNAYVLHEKHTRSNHACLSSIRNRSNLADILQKLAAKKPVKSWLLCVAMGNLRFKNSYICTEIRLSAPKITKTRGYNIIFPLWSISMLIMVIKTGKKTKTPPLDLAPIRFAQFVPRFFLRHPLYSFIISMWDQALTG